MHKISIAAAFFAALWVGEGHASSLTVDGFETGLPLGTDSDGTPVGYYTFAGAGSAVGISTTTTPPSSVPGSAPGNSVLQMDVDAASFSFAGFIHAFTNAGADQWVPQDWSAYDSLSFWAHGSNSGTDMFFDILDNRNIGSTTDDAERWTVNFQDDFSGWQQFEFAFTDFVRKEIGNGAPNDGLTLTDMHGYTFGTLGTGGPQSFYFDDITLSMPSAVPLPASAVLLGVGLFGLGVLARRRT